MTRRKMAWFLIVPLIILSVVPGCGRSAPKSSRDDTSRALETATQTIRAAEGGKIALPGGSSVYIPAGILKSDQSVTLSLLTSLPEQAPSGLIKSVGPVLSLSFAPARASQRGIAYAAGLDTVQAASSGIELDLDFSKSTASGYDGVVPLAEIKTPGATKDAFVGLPGTVDLSGRKARIDVGSDLLDAFEIPKSNAKVIAGLANWNRDLPVAAPQQYGPRLWDPLLNKWIGLDPSRLDKTKKTCVLVHGILSTVEDAYQQGSDCVSGIGKNNGCEQVIGFNYRWWEPVMSTGKEFATFLSQLQGFDNLVVEAHSMGGVVSMAALSYPETYDLKVSKLVTLGSPLSGTIAADSFDKMVTVLANYHLGRLDGALVPTRTLKEFLDNSSARDMMTTSPILPQIRTLITRNHPGMDVVPMAGTTSALVDYSAMKAIYGSVFGNEAQDTIVNTRSALGEGSGLNIKPGTAKAFPLSHTDLECNADVQREVGKAVNVAPPAVTTYSPPEGLTFTTPLGGPNPPSQTLIVKNAGLDGSTLNYVIKSNAPWLKISGPIRPLTANDSERYVISVETADLKEAKTYETTFSIDAAAPSKSGSVRVTLAIIAPTPTRVPTATTAPIVVPQMPTATATPVPTLPLLPPTATPTPPPLPTPTTAGFNAADINGKWQGTFNYQAVGFCPAQGGQWAATLRVSGNDLSIQWWDSFDLETLNTNTKLNGSTATFGFGSGDDSVQVTVNFISGTQVRGTMIGPVCTAASGRPNGTLRAHG